MFASMVCSFYAVLFGSYATVERPAVNCTIAAVFTIVACVKWRQAWMRQEVSE